MIDRDAFGRPGLLAAVSPSFEVISSLIRTTREAVLVVSSDLRIVAANETAAEIFERGNVPFSNRRLTEIVRDSRLHEAFRRAHDHAEAVDLFLELHGTQTRHLDIHIAPFDLNGGRYAVGFFYDVTEVDRLERVRQEFLSNISHELRTPLTSILAFVETLEDGAIDDIENNRRFLGVIRRNAERMNLLISDILELSLIESGNVSIEKVQVRLGVLVDDVFATLESKALEREVALSHNIDPAIRVAADPGRLEQMLNNLIDNAIKFNRIGGCVSVSAEVDGGRSTIYVEDSGEGIRPEQLSRIFERFYRVDRGRNREVGGTGLGLSIVKHLARLHGGEISARSELGRFTRFAIQLPVQ